MEPVKKFDSVLLSVIVASGSGEGHTKYMMPNER